MSIPRIDTKNANGTYDTDVATLTALSATNNSYYRQIDKDNPSAIAPGCTVTVTTAAKNTGGNRYQMVYDENEDGKVKPPTYTDEDSDPQPMTYINGGTYSFEMPEADTGAQRGVREGDDGAFHGAGTDEDFRDTDPHRGTGNIRRSRRR